MIELNVRCLAGSAKIDPKRVQLAVAYIRGIEHLLYSLMAL